MAVVFIAVSNAGLLGSRQVEELVAFLCYSFVRTNVVVQGCIMVSGATYRVVYATHSSALQL